MKIRATFTKCFWCHLVATWSLMTFVLFDLWSWNLDCTTCWKVKRYFRVLYCMMKNNWFCNWFPSLIWATNVTNTPKNVSRFTIKWYHRFRTPGDRWKRNGKTIYPFSPILPTFINTLWTQPLSYSLLKIVNSIDYMFYFFNERWRGIAVGAIFFKRDVVIMDES